MFRRFLSVDFVKQFIRLMSVMKKRIWLYAFSLLGMSFSFAVFLQVIMSLKFKSLFDAATTGDFSLLNRTVGSMILLILATCIICPVLSYLNIYCIKKTMAEVRVSIFSHIMNLPLSYYDKNHSGGIISCLTNDLYAMEGAYFWPLFMSVYSIILGVGSIIVMLSLNWILAVLIIALGIISTVINARYSKPIRIIRDDIQKYLGTLTERLIDFLSGFYVIKMFHLGKVFFGYYDNSNTGLMDESMKYARKSSSLEGINFLLNYLNFAFIIVISAAMVSHNTSKIGTVIVCLQLQSSITFMFRQLGGFITQLQLSLAAADRVFKLMDEALEPQQYLLKSGGNCEKMIGMNGVCFEYDDEPVLDNITFALEEGKTIAFVGPSGSGKSTIAKLLLGFYPHKAGNIYVLGKPISQYHLSQLRDLIAYVPQNAFLFNMSIKENIMLGREDASYEEILEASQIADAHEFIIALTDGYDTFVGEGGCKLSGGQRQRVALARALVKKAPVIILDEATSALDSEHERVIFERLKDLRRRHTFVIISHRLSTVMHADVIYAIHKGSIAEYGSHDELMGRNGIYRQLYN